MRTVACIVGVFWTNDHWTFHRVFGGSGRVKKRTKMWESDWKASDGEGKGTENQNNWYFFSFFSVPFLLSFTRIFKFKCSPTNNTNTSGYLHGCIVTISRIIQILSIIIIQKETPPYIAPCTANNLYCSTWHLVLVTMEQYFTFLQISLLPNDSQMETDDGLRGKFQLHH